MESIWPTRVSKKKEQAGNSLSLPLFFEIVHPGSPSLQLSSCAITRSPPCFHVQPSPDVPYQLLHSCCPEMHLLVMSSHMNLLQPLFRETGRRFRACLSKQSTETRRQVCWGLTSVVNRFLRPSSPSWACPGLFHTRCCSFSLLCGAYSLSTCIHKLQQRHYWFFPVCSVFSKHIVHVEL